MSSAATENTSSVAGSATATRSPFSTGRSEPESGCGGSGTCAIGMADLECPNCPVEWGVRYRDGKTMKRFSRQVAEDSVRQIPGRTLMWRVSDGWREYRGQPTDAAIR